MRLAVDVAARFSAPGADPFDVEVALEVAEGETLVVLGPSGAGKTLLLETVAGYHPHEGSIHAGERDVTAEPPEARGFGFVFQNYALFPHLTVRENVAFGARYHEATRDPDALLAELGIADLADRTPATLSGGEAQRVALARSLAIAPSTLLMDEPLSALDVPTQEALRADLAASIEDITTLYVTHNRTTALELADRIAVMRDGRVVQTGSPAAVFDRPASPFVARFTGANCVPAGSWAEAVDGGPATGTLAIRPEHVRVGEGGAAASVERVTKADVGSRVRLERDGTVVEANVAAPPPVGATTTVGFPPDRVTRFDTDERAGPDE